MKQIWLLRHGQSTAQVNRTHELDPDLSARGAAQAAAVHDALGDLRFDCILISPLKRTRRTYELAAPHGQRVVFDSRLIECGFDVDYARLQPYTTPDYAQPDTHGAWTWPAAQRVESLLKTIHSLSEQNILLVSHWGLLSLLLMRFLGATIPQELIKGRIPCSAPLANGAYGVLVCGHPKYGDSLHTWNVCDHLKGQVLLAINETLDNVSEKPAALGESYASGATAAPLI